MSRRSRLHVPGGVYYIAQRSSSHQSIFSEPSDYADFERLLAVLLTRCRAKVHAFCWEQSMIHMAVQISDVPVGRLMQRLTSQFSRHVHQKKGQAGHLFQHRYHSVLIDPDAYLLKLIRYLHLIPVRAELVRDPADYTLSSHRAYLGLTTIPWLTTQVAMRKLGHRGESARFAYGQLMRERPAPEEETCFLRGSPEDPRILGDRQFLSVVPRHQRVFRSSCSIDQVIDTVSVALGVDRDQVLSRSRQRHLTLARALVTWYATERGIATLAEVARRLQRDPSTLFMGVERYRALRPDLFDLTALRDVGPLISPVRLRSDTNSDSANDGAAAMS